MKLVSEFQADIDAIAAIPSVPNIFDVIRQTTGMGFVAVARVTEARWVACEVLDGIDFGLKPGGELEVESTICHEIRQSREAVAIDNVAEDARYCRHHTPAQYGFQSYISLPIILSDGSFFGTLCAIDPKPAQVNNPRVIGMFRLFAELIAKYLDAREHVTRSQMRLQDELETAKLREQFIAILGHDLRNPIAAIDAGMKMLRGTPLDAKAVSIVGLVQKSVGRMANLVDNVMDFARGKLGSGFSLNVAVDEPLEPVLEQVVDEYRMSWPDRTIETDFELSHPIECDHAKIAQLFSNLVGNALTHGAEDTSVKIRAKTAEDRFELSVSNAGIPIPPGAVGRLFQPFSRLENSQGKDGLGLGLYIAAQIAEAHDGTLNVSSTPEETRFTLRIPLTLQKAETSSSE